MKGHTQQMSNDSKDLKVRIEIVACHYWGFRSGEPERDEPYF